MSMRRWELTMIGTSSIRTRLIYALVALVGASIVSVLLAGSSYAVAGRGYFNDSNWYDIGTPSVSTNDVLSGSALAGGSRVGYAMPDWLANGAGNDKQQIYDWLKARAAANGAMPADRDELGVSFIVHTMIGDPAGGTKRLYASDWTELHDRLVMNPNIRVDTAYADPNIYGNGRVSFANDTQQDDFFAVYNSSARPLIIIEDTSNNTRYVLERYCANPIGELSLPDYTPFWGVNGYSSARVNGVASSTAYPGDTITWTHRLRNNMPGTNMTTSPVLRYETRKSYSGNLSPSDYDTSDNTVSLGVNGTFTLSGAGLSYTVQTSDVGADLCQHVRYAWRSYTDHVWTNSSEACVEILLPYDLKPYISGSTDQYVSPGQEDVAIEPRVNNVGGDTLSDVYWQLSRYVVRPDSGGGASYVMPSEGESSDTPEVYYDSPRLDGGVSAIASGDRAFSGGNDVVVNAMQYDVPGVVDFGTRICFALSVRPYATGETRWRHSEPLCLLVAKLPNVHVWGNDVRVGSAIDIANNSINSAIGTNILQSSSGNYFGSWSEYGVIAPGAVNNFSSGSGLFQNGAGNNNNAQNSWSNLTFARPSGNFVATSSLLGSLPDIASYASNNNLVGMTNANPPGVSPLNNWPGGGPSSDYLLVQKTGTVRISGDIERPNGSYGDVEDMPQLVIIADDINIEGNVERIDAWLIASGTINTCATGASLGANFNQCDDHQLVINGPVIANQLKLYRTHGGNTVDELNVPAEIINFTADSYIWAYHQSQLAGGLRTTSVRELPPRY